MKMIHPFKAVLPATDKAAHLVSRTYQDYSKEEREAELKYNPYSFLQILNPGYKFHHKMQGAERFKMVRNRYLEFLEEGYLQQISQDALYVYQNIDPLHTYTGLIAGASATSYGEGKIKKHEDTLEEREQLFKEYLKNVGFNAEPVLLTHSPSETLSSAFAKAMQGKPLLDISTTDHNRHKIWAISEPEEIKKIQQAYQSLGNLYIADGHHRSASSHLLSEEMGKDKATYNLCMSYLIPEDQLKIYEFNRSVTDLNDMEKSELLVKLDENFRIQNRGLDLYKPSKRHHFSMYLDGEFYSLYLRKELIEDMDPLQELDTQILYELILRPLLDIKDLRNDKRISYSYGEDDLLRMKKSIDEGNHAIGFGLYPSTVEQMKKIADAGQRMPPKSTFIRPKLPSGLTIYEF